MIHFKIYDLNMETYLQTKRFTQMIDVLNYLEGHYVDWQWKDFEIHEFKRNLDTETVVTVNAVSAETVSRPTIY